MIKKLPNGISNYEELVEDGYYYVDKTRYIEKLEELSDKRIMFLRPRKFGKTLFTSVLENYYDIKKKEKFETLYGETYIGKNPTKLHNTYDILKFNFSGINTENEEMTMKGFREVTEIAIESFVKKYNIEFYINKEQTTESILRSLLETFKIQKENEKIYVIIDEYDHFANELLGFMPEQFRTLVSKNGRVRKWYEVLKQGTESVVDRIFITGVAPITLDSLTSGFNISKDITQDEEFNEMVGFTTEELIELMNVQDIPKENQETILPIMKQNYDGYMFSLHGKEKMYNSNMTLYFLADYTRLGHIPERLVDVNIASDYSKLGKMLNLCKGENRADIIQKTVSGEAITNNLTEKFNPAMEFKEKELISMLYYLGYLTIVGEEFETPMLSIPNKVMKEIYADYFIEALEKDTNFSIEGSQYIEMTKEIALEGKINTITEMLGKYLSNLSNRDYMNFDEKYVKLIFYCIAMNLKVFNIRSEMEIHRKYPDIAIISKDKTKDYASVIIEFKYLKKGEESKLAEKQKEAREQIEEYGQTEEMKEIPKLHKYAVVAVVDKIYVEEIN